MSQGHCWLHFYITNPPIPPQFSRSSSDRAPHLLRIVCGGANATGMILSDASKSWVRLFQEKVSISRRSKPVFFIPFNIRHLAHFYYYFLEDFLLFLCPCRISSARHGPSTWDAGGLGFGSKQYCKKKERRKESVRKHWGYYIIMHMNNESGLYQSNICERMEMDLAYRWKGIMATGRELIRDWPILL